MICVLVLSLLTVLLLPTQGTQVVSVSQRSYEVDYTNNQFLKDGLPFRYVSGSLHYFRVPRAYWRDRMRKYRAAGLNAITTYIEWSLHEPSPGEYDFSGEKDFQYFMRLAEEEGLLVILRPGPYICAERDFGGYPPWILHENPNVILRTSDPSHTKYVSLWLKTLFPIIQPLLYGNGGPIIMVQVENEYGSYFACDRNYTSWLRDVFHGYVKDKAVLFTTDGSSEGFLKCGPIPGVFTTVDFGCGGNVTEEFQALRKKQPQGPLVNSEFYPGWLTHWGEPYQTVQTDCVVNSTRQLLLANASFNFYMFHGGTNFGFTSGANSPPYQPVLTSYDYNAPILESGSLTEKYYAIQAVMAEFGLVQNMTIYSSEPVAYGTVKMEPTVSLFHSGTGIEYGTFKNPQTFESLQQYSGLMMYSTTLPPGYRGRGYLVANDVHDRAIVYVNNKPAGVLSRTDKVFSMDIAGQEGQPLGLLVENLGHINFGNMSDSKGLIGNVTLDGDILQPWKHTGYPLMNMTNISSLPTMREVTLPAYYSGSFTIPRHRSQPFQDTFVDMSGWGKGVLYVNDVCLGRYWPSAGPQLTLYLPGYLLKSNNTVIVLELETVESSTSVSLVSHPRYTASETCVFHPQTLPNMTTDNISVKMVKRHGGAY